MANPARHKLPASVLSAVALNLLLGLTFVAHAQQPSPIDPIEGKWYGTSGFPQDRVELGFEFKRNDKQELKAYLYLPLMNFYGLEVPGPVLRDGHKYTNKDYILSLSLENEKLEGTYFSLKAPITLERTTQLPTEAPMPELPAGPGPKWQAKLGAPIYAPAAVRDDHVYVGTSGGLFYSINVKDGSFAWTFTAGRPIHGEALVTADHVYFRATTDTSTS